MHRARAARLAKGNAKLLRTELGMAIAAVRTKEEILQRLRGQEKQLRSLGVRRLGLFGSFLRGEQAPESDVDVLLEFAPGKKNFDSFLRIAYLLEDALQRQVELVTPEALSPYLGPKILAEVEVVLGGP